MTQFNVTVFSGKAYRVEKKNAYREETLSLPEGTLLLASEVVMDGDEPVVELWLAVPHDAVVESSSDDVVTVHPDSTVDLPPALPVVVAEVEDEEQTIDEAYGHYVEEEEDDEFYADY